MTENFIEKAILIHGDKYNYSKVDYNKCDEKVIIICKEHGDFLQIPNNHLFGYGCSKCGGNAKSNTKEFIEKCIKKHGNKYDYSKVDYKNNITKVIIICREHGEFEQTPKLHLKTSGCGKCVGTAKSNTKEFIEKSKLIHGDKYDYSKVDYINSTTNIIIICREHGEFQQTPKQHLKKHGCVKCSIQNNTLSKRKTINEFLEKCKDKHGDLYDYSKVDYKNLNTKVIIICKIHGEFEQTPSQHLKTSGCGKCVGIAKSNTNEFIEKSKLIHGDKYDYSKVNYINSTTKVIIICKKHGDFLQRPNNHLINQGCNKCGNILGGLKNKSNTIEFIEKSILVHGDKYDYSKVNYINSTTKVIIICKKHGEFLQIPSDHYNSGCGCQKCTGIAKLTTPEFIKRSIKLHGDKYNYSKVNYINNNIKVLIGCKKHGDFYQNPKNHYMSGSGCPKCCNNTYSKQQILWLDFLSKYYDISIQHALNDGEFLIPNTNYKADGYCKDTNTIYEFHGDFWHGNPEIYKQDEINKKTNCSFKELYEKTLIKEEKNKRIRL